MLVVNSANDLNLCPKLAITLSTPILQLLNSNLSSTSKDPSMHIPKTALSKKEVKVDSKTLNNWTKSHHCSVEAMMPPEAIEKALEELQLQDPLVVEHFVAIAHINIKLSTANINTPPTAIPTTKPVEIPLSDDGGGGDGGGVGAGGAFLCGGGGGKAGEERDGGDGGDSDGGEGGVVDGGEGGDGGDSDGGGGGELGDGDDGGGGDGGGSDVGAGADGVAGGGGGETEGAGVEGGVGGGELGGGVAGGGACGGGDSGGGVPAEGGGVVALIGGEGGAVGPGAVLGGGVAIFPLYAGKVETRFELVIRTRTKILSKIEAACRCHKKEVQSAAINPPPSPPAQLSVAVVNNEEVKFEFVKEDLETSGRSRISVG
nr:hypothetical protein Itr_chr14CG06520 [Ipomoea trifida]